MEGVSVVDVVDDWIAMRISDKLKLVLGELVEQVLTRQCGIFGNAHRN